MYVDYVKYRTIRNLNILINASAYAFIEIKEPAMLNACYVIPQRVQKVHVD